MIYAYHSLGTILATTPKCASTSIVNEFRIANTKELRKDLVDKLQKSRWKVVGVVRDPIDRFESAYNFFQHGQCGKFPTGSYENIEAFTDAVLAGVYDEHWEPQSNLLKECDNYADLETLPLQTKENAVNHIDLVTYRLDELKAFYASDYKIRGSAWLL